MFMQPGYKREAQNGQAMRSCAEQPVETQFLAQPSLAL